MAYIDAMIANDADAAPFADNVRFTENTEVIGIRTELRDTASVAPRQNYPISDREAMGVRMPYRSGNGWNRFWR